MDVVSSLSRQADNSGDKRPGGDEKRRKAKSSASSADVAEIVNKKDDQRLLAIFPEEIWKLILEEVKDPSDLENISNSSPFFRNLLSPQRVQFLFPKVLKILHIHHHVKKSLSMDERLEDWGFDDESNEVNEWNGESYRFCNGCFRWVTSWWFALTMTFRLVCKNWNAVTDKFFHDNRVCDSSFSKDAIVCPSGKADLNLKIYTPTDVLPFLRHFESTHYSEEVDRSPFISKFATFRLFFERNGQGHIPNEFSRLLSRYGHHIWCCHLQVHSTILSYHYLAEVLTLLPKLKELEVTFDVRYDDVHVQPQITEFESEIAQYPLPTLEDLRLVSLCTSPEPVFKELLRSNGHMSVLTVPVGSWEISPIIRPVYQFHSSSLPNLEQLSMVIQSSSDLHALTHRRVNWRNLTALDISFFTEFIEWGYIFFKLKKWAKTLKRLKIRLPAARNKREQNRIVSEKLELPGITELDLTLYIYNVSQLDFISPMESSLEFLNIYLRVQGDKNLTLMELESGQNLKLLGYHDKLWKSNIWTLYPKLKEVRIKIDQSRDPGPTIVSKCTRREWKQKTKNCCHLTSVN